MGSSERDRAFLHLTPISCSVEGFFKTTLCARSRRIWMKRAASRTGSHHELGRTKAKESNTTESARQGFYYSASFLPIIKPLINSPVHREITQGCSWLQRSNCQPPSGASVFVLFFCFSLRLIVPQGPAVR